MKPVYIYFSFRHFQEEDKMVVATSAYADPDGKKQLGMRVVEVKAWDSNNYVKILQSYANALNYIYDKQETLKKNGFDQVILMTSNKILHGWLVNNECNNHRKWFKIANKSFRSGAKKEIEIAVGLGLLAKSDLAYKYCKLELVDANLKMTYRGVSIATDEEVKQQRQEVESMERQAEPETVSIDKLLAMDDMAADISFSGFIQE